MESPLPVIGKEFFFAGTCLPSCSLATDIHVTIFYAPLTPSILSWFLYNVVHLSFRIIVKPRNENSRFLSHFVTYCYFYPSYRHVHAVFLRLASELRRSTAINSEAMVAAVGGMEDDAFICLTHANPYLSDRGLNQIYCALYLKWPRRKIWRVFFFR
jgi:hypothetical protein